MKVKLPAWVKYDGTSFVIIYSDEELKMRFKLLQKNIFKR